MEGKKKPSKYDWDNLYLEWLTFNGTLLDFFEKKNVGKVGYRKSSTDRWIQRKKDVAKNAVNKAMKRIENNKSITFEKHIHANDKLLALITKRLKACEKDGMKSDEIKILNDALERNMKTKSFMEGGPTDRVEKHVKSLHADITGLIEKFNGSG